MLAMMFFCFVGPVICVSFGRVGRVPPNASDSMRPWPVWFSSCRCVSFIVYFWFCWIYSASWGCEASGRCLLSRRVGSCVFYYNECP